MSKGQNLGLKRSATPKALPNRRKELDNNREIVACKHKQMFAQIHLAQSEWSS